MEKDDLLRCKNKIKGAAAVKKKQKKLMEKADLKFPPFGWSTFSIQEGRNRCLLLHSCSILGIDKTFSPFFWCKCMLAPSAVLDRTRVISECSEFPQFPMNYIRRFGNSS